MEVFTHEMLWYLWGPSKWSSGGREKSKRKKRGRELITVKAGYQVREGVIRHSPYFPPTL